MPVFDYFKFFAPIYDSVFSVEMDTERLSIFDVKPGMRVLDAGGGTGRISGRLGCLDCNLIIADESLNMLRQTLLKDGLKPVNSLIEHMPFPDLHFDRIIMVDAFHHVLNQADCSQEMWRILKPGGKIVIEEPDITQFKIKLLALGEKIALMRSHFLSANQISGLFKRFYANVDVHREGVNVWVVIHKKNTLE